MNNETQQGSAADSVTFSTDTSDLEDCHAPALVELADGHSFDLRIAPVAKAIDGQRVRMLAYTPGTCPACEMKLIPEMTGADASAGHSHRHDTAEGLEWEDLMPEINRASDSSNMIWKLVDRETGKENWEIDWAFRVDDQVKMRLVNDMEQDHPMHHPFHIHGAERFFVISRDGVTEPSLVWKDTVLVRADEIVDILLDVSNPGLWMAHRHIAEHNQSGMMFSFTVSDVEEG